ncbi:MAG: AAA family ATPase [Bacteroidota bacterium]|nr:AAA family ATPase [Bacteroidota bacterium]
MNRFNTELKELGAKRIQVELVKTRIDRGRTMHKIKLKDVEQYSDNSTAVLSDGERRIVALAAFLADVVSRPEPSPFVFDDPISSLDNDFEWEVAIRLAKLATERQVIVLTHRLSLYGVLEEAEKVVRANTGSTKKNIEQRCIESFSGSTGHPADEQAWTQNTTKANNTLIDRLNQARKFWDSGDSTNYKIHAQSICSDLRKLIERTVEDDLLNEIVRRHRRSVMTQNKLNRLVPIQKEDCEFIDGLMTKYSKFEHSQSSEMTVEVPDEPSLREDLEKLRDWRNEFKSRT